jgi:hypothetical protein
MLRFIKISFFILFLLLVSPLINQLGDFLSSITLAGYTEKPPKEKLSWNNWFNNKYQEKSEERIKFDLRAKGFLIRLNNQLRFSLFGELKNRYVTYGRNGQYFQNDYIDSYFGRDYIGEDSIRKKMLMLQDIMDTLQNTGTRLLIVLAPSKVFFTPESIPKEYDLYELKSNNYNSYVKVLNELNIDHIDFNTYFKSMKNTSPYLLYSPGGAHWSTYGAYIAIDTILKSISEKLNYSFPHYHYPEIQLFREARYSDNDVFSLANLLWTKQITELAYPKMEILNDTNTVKPNVLAIADSYYSILMYNYMHDYFFDSNSAYWFYFNNIWTKRHEVLNGKLGTTVEQVQDFSHEFQSRDLIILLSTDSNLDAFPWGFIEKAHALYFPDSMQREEVENE